MATGLARRARRSSLPRGRLLRRRALGGIATYRVLAARGAVVDVEVVDAPGLALGTSLRLTAAAAAAMANTGTGVIDAERQGVRPASARGVRAVPRIG